MSTVAIRRDDLLLLRLESGARRQCDVEGTEKGPAGAWIPSSYHRILHTSASRPQSGARPSGDGRIVFLESRRPNVTNFVVAAIIAVDERRSHIAGSLRMWSVRILTRHSSLRTVLIGVMKRIVDCVPKLRNPDAEE